MKNVIPYYEQGSHAASRSIHENSVALNFAPIPDSPELTALRQEVRDFLEQERQSGSFARTPEGWDRYDPDFSRKVAARGWIGMTWPRQYGGQERTALERYVVAEELLTAGAPVRAHWLADRQIGPLLLSYGSEQQKLEYLPRIAAGECYFCVGLSEPDSGSDLASIRTRAIKVDGGWKVTGTKVWTSNAHLAHMMNLFARTTPWSEESRHSGVTQFLVNLRSPELTIRPIVNIAGEHDFNEVVFNDFFVADAAVIGTVGGAWKQVSGELAHERSGSERWVYSYGLLARLVAHTGRDADSRHAEKVGRLVAHLWTLHRMSFSIAHLLEGGHAPDVEAALVKDLGTRFDQVVPAVAREILSEAVRANLPADNDLNAMLDHAIYYSPSFTIRGGTTEILRGIIARGLGLR